VLGSSLAGQGVPQATLYGGMLSVPAMVALNVILLPQMGIKGAAIASDVAYAINAAVILLIFRRVARLPLRETLLVTRADLAESLSSAKRMVAKVWA
jgi:Na+-driven multidrug efflux pump